MKTRFLAAAVVLLVLGLAAYYSALDNPLIFDDEALIEGNPNLTWSRAASLVSADYFDLFPGRWVSYRPVSTLSYIVNRSLFGEDYRLWRLSYLAGHVLNAFLLFVFFSTFASPGSSFLASAFFLLHPIHSEVINQVSFNEEIMMTTFILAAWLLLVARRRGLGRHAGPAAVAFFALALLTKETAILFPLVVLAWVLAERPPAPPSGRGLRTWLLPAALLLPSGLYAALRLGPLGNPLDPRRPGLLVGGMATGARELPRLLLDYVRRFLWPFDLAAIYHVPPSGWRSPEVIGGLAMVVVIAALVVAGLRRRRPHLAVPAVWFVSYMSPLVSNLVWENRTYAFDRYLYLPSVGLVWGGLLAAQALSRKWPPRRVPFQAAALVLSAVCLAAFLGAIGERNRVWSGNLSLWTDTARKSPSSPIAHYNLAYTLKEEGDLRQAEEEYLLAIEADPGNAEVHYNLANLYGDLGEHGLAEQNYLRAMEKRPGYLAAMLNLGNLYLRGGAYEKAAELYGLILQGNGEYAMAWNNLGHVRLMQGRTEEAVACFRQALRIDPGYRQAAIGLRSAMQHRRNAPAETAR